MLRRLAGHSNMTSIMTREGWQQAAKCNRDASRQNAFAVCIADWDAATHMSKPAWRNARLRSVKEEPTAFREPQQRLSRSMHAGVLFDRSHFSAVGLWGP